MYEAAVTLIKKGLAYVSDRSPEQMREYRGTLTEPGKEDPDRGRSVEENLALFEDMKISSLMDSTNSVFSLVGFVSSKRILNLMGNIIKMKRIFIK